MYDAIEMQREQIAGDPSLKPGTRDYYNQRITALFESRPSVEKKEIRSVSKTDCLNRAAKFGAHASPTAFNHTISVLRSLLEIGIEVGGMHTAVVAGSRRAARAAPNCEDSGYGGQSDFHRLPSS